MNYGYARVSSNDQKLDRQLESLKNAGCEEIVVEKASAATVDRPELIRLLSRCERGDKIIIHSIDRISRSTRDLLSLVDELKSRGVSLVSINEKWLDTSENNAFSDLLLTIMSGLAEYERKMIRQRQREGIELAKQRGKYKGRVKKYHTQHPGMKHAIELYQQRIKTVKEICEITKVSRSALYRELEKGGKWYE